MNKKPNTTSQRKKEHIELCLTDEVAFKNKTTGFENYDFINDAITEVEIDKINFETEFFGKRINYPFLISCMTGGTPEAGNINSQLAIAANDLNIPLGVGSQRQALENKKYHDTYKIIRQNAPKIPILGNIGAAQIVQTNNYASIRYLVDLVEADAMVIHLNPAQEMIQENGQPNFKGLLNKIEELVMYLDVPVIAKEVGAGISRNSAKKLLGAGVAGIDVAGAGGTTWTGVEILRNNGLKNNPFWDWGIPTSFCLKEVYQLKVNKEFTLIASGGINDGFTAAKAFALGADLVASARIILQELDKNNVSGVLNLITNWFETIKKVMFLTGAQSIKQFQNNKIIKKENLF